MSINSTRTPSDANPPGADGSNFASVLDLLDGVRRISADEAVAICPAHPRSVASLSVRRAPDGAIQLHCYAGCTQESVLRAMGRDRSLLAPQRERIRELIGDGSAP